MMNIFNALKAEGEEAVLKSVWLLVGAILGAMATAFLAGAVSFALATVIPVYAAVLAGAAVLVLAALFCLLIAKSLEVKSNNAAYQNSSTASLLDQSTLALVQKNLLNSPGKTIIAGLVAGAALGALDAFETRRR